MRITTSLLCVVMVIVACDNGRDLQSLPPPPQVSRSAAAVPNPAPPPPGEPRPRGEHPLYRVPRAPQPNDPIRDPAVRPALLESTAPAYTDEARKARIQGVVIVEAIVERDGRVSAARVLKPLPFGLSDQAVEAVKRSRYSPGKDDRGAPVRTLLNVPVSFALR